MDLLILNLSFQSLDKYEVNNMIGRIMSTVYKNMKLKSTMEPKNYSTITSTEQGEKIAPYTLHTMKTIAVIV